MPQHPARAEVHHDAEDREDARREDALEGAETVAGRRVGDGALAEAGRDQRK